MADGTVTIEVELTKEQIEQGLKSLKADLNDLKKSTSKISSKIAKGLTNIGNVATKAGKTLTLGLTTPLIALGTSGVKYNAQMEDFEANLTTLLGNADKAKEMLADLKEMANTTPFETSDLLESTQMMLGFGLAADKTKGYLQTLGDISMGNSEKLMSLTRAFSQIGAAGKATMEDINQMIDAGFNPLQIMSETTGKSMATLRDEVSKGNISFEDIANAMKIATSEGGRYYNAMEKASQTMNGKLSTALDALKTALGNLTQSLLPIVTQVVEKITEWANAFANLDEGTQKIILTIAGILAIAGPILSIIGKVSSGISSMIKIVPTLSKGISAVSTAFKTFNTVLSANPIILIVTVIATLVTALITLWNTNEDFRNAIISAWNAICDFFKSIPTFFQNLWENIKNFFINGWNSIVSFFTQTIPQWIQNIITWFQQLPYNIGLLIGQIIGHIANFGVSIWNWITTELPQIINNIIDWFAQLPGNIWNWLVQTVQNIIKWIADMQAKANEGIKNIVDSIVNWFKELPGKIVDVGKNIVEGLWNGITGAASWLWDKITGWCSGIVDGIKNFFGIHSPSKVFNEEVGKFLALGLGEGFDDNLGKVYKQMQSAVDFETQKLSANLSTTATNNKLFTANITMQPSDVYMDSTKVGRMVTPAVTKTLRGAGI